MSFSNNGTKVRIFGEFTKFLSDFFLLKIELFFVRGYSLTHLLTFDINILSFYEIEIYYIILL